MQSMDRPVTRSVYVAVLRKDLPSPLAPESDEEKPKEPEKAETAKPGAEEAGGRRGQGQREAQGGGRRAERSASTSTASASASWPCPIPARNYLALGAGKEGILFILEGRRSSRSIDRNVAAARPPEVRPVEAQDGQVPGQRQRFPALGQRARRSSYSKRGQWMIAGDRRSGRARQGRAEHGGHGGLRRAARRVEADVPRGLADRARFLLRRRPPRARPAGRGKALRALRRRRGQPRRT